jgi:dihydrofolate reductase
MLKDFTIIAGVTKQNGIGINGKLPWNNSVDMKYFKNITSQCIDNNKRNAVIMGRNTFKSFNYKPLPNRLNICITSMNPDLAYSFFMGKKYTSLVSHKSLDFGFFSIHYPLYMKKSSYIDPNIMFFSSLDNALKFLYNSNDIENIFVIGGSIIYKEAIERKDCSELIINEIDCNVECDTFFPVIDKNKYTLISSKDIGNGVCNNRYIKRFNRSNTI